MRRIWLASTGFILVMAALAAVSIVRDRTGVIRAVQERTHSMARLIVAHGEAAIENASKVIAGLDGPVRGWDLEEPEEGERLFALMLQLLAGSPQISSAWVMDAQGISRLDSWSYPSKPIAAPERPYFKAHLEGAPEPVILGDSNPGAVTGRQRFTFSRSQRNPDGSLHAIIVVGIYNAYFDRLYAEVASWPGARASLYSLNGGVLGQLVEQPSVSPEYIAEVEAGVLASPSGSKIIPEPDGSRLASWHRSVKYPHLYATSSQPIELALAEWRERSWMLGVVTGLAALGLGGLVFYALRSITAREAVRQQEMLAREVHHRVKNSLQMAVSFLHRHARQISEPAARNALVEASMQVSAIADVHELIQESAALDRLDVGALLQQLCSHLERSSEQWVAFQAGKPLLIGVAQATSVAITVNELVTNALKHAQTHVEVSCSQEQDELVLEVRDDGPGLPADFELHRTARFGLRLVASIATQLGGSVTAQSAEKGAVFSLRLPLHRLLADEPALDQRRAPPLQEAPRESLV